MPEWTTVVDRLGTLAGGMQHALNAKEKAEAATRYDRWHDLEKLNAKYALANAIQGGQNYRAELQALSKAQPKPITWSEDSKITDAVSEAVTTAFTNPLGDGNASDLFSGDELTSDAQPLYAELSGMAEEALRSRPDILKDPSKVKAFLNQWMQDYAPIVTDDARPWYRGWFGDQPSYSFGGSVGAEINRIRQSLQRITSPSQRRKALQKVQQDLAKKYPPQTARILFQRISGGM